MIDTHVHLWRYASPWMAWLADRPPSWDIIRRDFAWADLRRELDAAHVAEVILMQACTTPEETVMLLEIAEQQPSVLGVVGWATLRSPAATERQLEDFDGKLVGLRNNHLWAPDGDIIGREQCLASVRLLSARGLPLDLHFPDYTSLPLALRLVEQVPDVRLVIDHLGKPDLGKPATFASWSEAIAPLSRHPDVFLKYSGWATFTGRTEPSDVQRYIDRAIELFGTERIIFASNWPVALVAGSYRDTYDATLSTLAGLSAVDLDNIMYGSARRCYLNRQ
ncbi:amidohydrolase family protein [uncultured Sphingomonas sp.]|uniref:amidohydrolase family protein n=1 Tax=uncultured Sphingomonas sp. TaxID=158754 RepID=UPI0035CA0F1F